VREEKIVSFSPHPLPSLSWMRRVGRENTHTLLSFFSVKIAITTFTKNNTAKHEENIMYWGRDAQGNQASF